MSGARAAAAKNKPSTSPKKNKTPPAPKESPKSDEASPTPSPAKVKCVYGAFLLACYDSGNEEFQSICKISTGFTEAVLEERSVSLRETVIPKPMIYYSYADTSNADTLDVWEVKAAELTISPVYCAAVGVVNANKGISLRFPRLVRVREDKKPEEASSSEQVAEMYNAQSNKSSKHQDDKEDED
ncbi:hypothetical protein ACLB2K_029633 [Fragaria x ananassa]